MNEQQESAKIAVIKNGRTISSILSNACHRRGEDLLHALSESTIDHRSALGGTHFANFDRWPTGADPTIYDDLNNGITVGWRRVGKPRGLKIHHEAFRGSGPDFWHGRADRRDIELHRDTQSPQNRAFRHL